MERLDNYTEEEEDHEDDPCCPSCLISLEEVDCCWDCELCTDCCECE